MYPDLPLSFFAAMDLSIVSASDVPFPLVTGSSPHLLIAYKDAEVINPRFDYKVTDQFKDEEQHNTEVKGSNQVDMASLLTTNISVNNSSIQSGILTHNEGESLVDLTIDPNSAKGEFGLACFETTLN